MNKILVLECNFLKFKYLVKCLYVIKHGYFQPYTIPLGTYVLYINWKFHLQVLSKNCFTIIIAAVYLNNT